jgi:hypothetical protein
LLAFSANTVKTQLSDFYKIGTTAGEGTVATEVTLHVESWQIVAEPSDNFLDRKPEGVAFSPQCVLPPIILVGQLQAGEIRHAIL